MTAKDMEPQEKTVVDEHLRLTQMESTLWQAADKLRGSVDAANYKHVVLGLVFLKYVSSTFEQRREELHQQLQDPNGEWDFIHRKPPEERDADIALELAEKENYTEANVFWIPEIARWHNIEESMSETSGAQLNYASGPYTFISFNKRLDDALDAIEDANDNLRDILNKPYVQLRVDEARLKDLFTLFSNLDFEGFGSMASRDILGHIYEYFLGEFALLEGKKGGQYYTPKSVLGTIVDMLAPKKGRIYDPAMGSGGFFVETLHHLEEADLPSKDVHFYGQELNMTTWRLAAMNMIIRGKEYEFGKAAGDTLAQDIHQGEDMDYVMANPPFNMKEWQTGDGVANDVRWAYGVPPANNANFAWLQHMLHHLKQDGLMALLLANGSLSSTTKGEGSIRAALLQQDRVECIVALPSQMFINTQIPACIWVLSKNKGADASRKLRERKGSVLFIDAREQGKMANRVHRVFEKGDRQKIAQCFQSWRASLQQIEVDGKKVGYVDEPGFCKAVSLDEIAKHDYVLTPGRYVDPKPEEDDGEAFADKMARLTGTLKQQFARGRELEGEIREQLAGIGYDV